MNAAEQGRMCGETYSRLGWTWDAAWADFKVRRARGETADEIVNAITKVPYPTYRDVPFELQVPL